MGAGGVRANLFLFVTRCDASPVILNFAVLFSTPAIMCFRFATHSSTTRTRKLTRTTANTPLFLSLSLSLSFSLYFLSLPLSCLQTHTSTRCPLPNSTMPPSLSRKCSLFFSAFVRGAGATELAIIAAVPCPLPRHRRLPAAGEAAGGGAPTRPDGPATNASLGAAKRASETHVPRRRVCLEIIFCLRATRGRRVYAPAVARSSRKGGRGSWGRCTAMADLGTTAA